MGPWPDRISILRRDSGAEERLSEDKVAICKPGRVFTRNWTLLGLDPGLPVSTNMRSKCYLIHYPGVFCYSSPSILRILSLFCKPRLSGSQGHHSLLSDAKPGPHPLMPLCFWVPECGRDMVFYQVASQLTKTTNDKVWRLSLENKGQELAKK